MKIKVISLLDSRHRRASITRQFAASVIEYEFFDALTPGSAPLHIDGYDESEFVLNCGRGATDGEIACYASHLALWRQCAASSQPFLILEDDARLTRSFATGLHVLMQRINDLGLIRAALPLPKQTTMIDCKSEFAIHYCRRVPLQALGYAISPAAAARLVTAGATIEEPVDKFIQRFWRHGQRVYSILPAIVEHSLLAEESDIGHRVRDRYDLITRIRRLARKSANSLARAHSNRMFSRGQKTHVATGGTQLRV